MASVALHTRLGFTPIGTYEDIGYKLGAWHSVWWCVLALQAATDAPPAPALVADVASSPAWAKAIADGERLLR
jgi:phosphinothricin acetyltransferase